MPENHTLPARNLRFACLGNYIPRQCGIATFTHDLCSAICTAISNDEACAVVAVNDTVDGYSYPRRVRFEIRQQHLADYHLAADYLNIRHPDVLLVQHEFGIFGGVAGTHLLSLLQDVRMPVVTTMHTVLQDPSNDYRRATEQLVEASDKIVVMADRAVEILESVYHVDSSKIATIPHGIPDLPFDDPDFIKDRFAVEGRKVMLTFGLLSPGKGIENVIRAMPELVQRHPDLVYVVLGATHPHVLRSSGESYRHSMQQLAEDLGVADNVLFLNRYVELSELCEYLGASDIYVTPYPGKDQIVSGTLAYALGAGNAVVSTPYWHAQELLAEGRGCLVPFDDPAAISREVDRLLSDADLRQAMRKKAYLHMRPAVWSEVAKSYLGVFDDVRSRSTTQHKSNSKRISRRMATQLLPELKLDHLRSLTDDVGILQHARFTIADRDHGYCVDDNARGLIFALEADELTPNARLVRTATTCLTFLQHAFNRQEKRFRNFMAYDRRWQEDIGSEDSHGRALWGLGVGVQLAPTVGFRTACMQLFNDGLEAVEQFSSPRSWAFALLGVHSYLRRYGGDSRVRQTRELLGEKLLRLFTDNVTDDWVWPESSLHYSNGVLPDALILTGKQTDNQPMLDAGLRSLDWLLRIKTGSPQTLSLVGNLGWYERGGEKAEFDQQPVNAQALLRACVSAFHATSDERWMREARRCLNWFLGRNPLGKVLYDYETGGCRDGLQANGVNENEGAESTLAWLLSLVAIQNLHADAFSAAESVRLDSAIQVPAPKTNTNPPQNTYDTNRDNNSSNDHSTTPIQESAAP